MSVSRADFIDIAAVLDANRAPLELVQDFADMLENKNERFNRAAFIAASTENVRQDAVSQVRILSREGVQPYLTPNV